MGISGFFLNHIYQNNIVINKSEIVMNPDTKNETVSADDFVFENLGADFWGILTTAILGFVGVSLNYVQKNRFGKVELQLERNNSEHQDMVDVNKDNFESIVKELVMLRDITTRKTVVDSFRNIINGYTRMTSDTALKPFIDAEGERLITFAEEIMNEHFTKTVQEQAIVKIDYTQEEQRNEAKHLFGMSFYKLYSEVQIKNVNTLKESMYRIASDELLNHKYERFKSVCETFLHTHLIDVIKLHLTLKIK